MDEQVGQHNSGSLRILHVLNHTKRANGHVCAMLDLACVQARSGHRVVVCSAGGDFDELMKSFSIRHVVIDQSRRPRALLAAMFKLWRLLRDVRPDIIHAHMMTSAVLVSLLRPVVRLRLVTTVHNEFQRSAILMAVGHRVIGVSKAVSRSMIKRGIPRRKVRTVLNGTVGSPRFPATPPVHKSLRTPAILYVGGLHPRKGVQDLLCAFRVVLSTKPEARLYLVGDGPHRSAYQALAAEIGGENIVFCGHSDDPREYLLAADIFVLASHAEPAGLVLSEAREANCAVVATEVGGIPEMLDGGKAGILVPPKRPDLIATELTRLLDDPSHLAKTRAASQINIDRLKLERVAAETEAVYRELL